jgi:hypothetical protein
MIKWMVDDVFGTCTHRVVTASRATMIPKGVLVEVLKN